MRFGRSGRRALAAALIATVVAFLPAACGSSGGRTAAPTSAEIVRALDRHAAAVLDGDEGAFLSGVSAAPASASFRRQQRAQFANLTMLPLTTWRYSIEERTQDASAERAATRKYRSPAVIEHVILHYALRGVDARTTTHDLYLTFIAHGGTAVLAGDTDLADAGGITWRGPWDFGPIVVVTGARVLVIGHAAQGNELDAIARGVDTAIPFVTAVWGTDWPQQVAVLVPSSTTELEADAGPSSDITPDIAAETVSDGADPLSGAALGLRLIVNPGALAKLSPIGVQIVLRHEITHIAAGAVTSDASPRWLVEGFADYVGQLHAGQKVPVIAAELAKQVRAGRLPTALPTESDFDAPATSAQSYEEGWLACRLIAARAGQAGLVRFYRVVASTLDATTSVPTGLGSVLHETTAQFIAQWRAYLRAELQ